MACWRIARNSSLPSMLTIWRKASRQRVRYNSVLPETSLLFRAQQVPLKYLQPSPVRRRAKMCSASTLTCPRNFSSFWLKRWESRWGTSKRIYRDLNIVLRAGPTEMKNKQSCLPGWLVILSNKNPPRISSSRLRFKKIQARTQFLLKTTIFLWRHLRTPQTPITQNRVLM